MSRSSFLSADCQENLWCAKLSTLLLPVWVTSQWRWFRTVCQYLPMWGQAVMFYWLCCVFVCVREREEPFFKRRPRQKFCFWNSYVQSFICNRSFFFFLTCWCVVFLFWYLINSFHHSQIKYEIIFLLWWEKHKLVLYTGEMLSVLSSSLIFLCTKKIWFIDTQSSQRIHFWVCRICMKSFISFSLSV